MSIFSAGKRTTKSSPSPLNSKTMKSKKQKEIKGYAATTGFYPIVNDKGAFLIYPSRENPELKKIEQLGFKVLPITLKL